MITLLLALSLQAPAPAGADLHPESWTLVDPGARAMRYLNRDTLFLSSGIAVLNGVSFADGVIEVDVALHGHPSFAGVLFRAQSHADYELIYVRPQRSRQPDALQYTPIFGDQEAWQLYYGDGYTAAAELSLNRWVHLRIVVAGFEARVYVDGAAEPQLVVTDLKRPWARGAIGLWGRSGGANFSNVRITPAPDNDPGARPRTAAAAGTIEAWRLSAAYDAATVDPRQLPAASTAPSWDAVASEPSGIVNVAQYRRRVSEGRSVVFARTMLRSPRTQRVRLTFGYSDDVSVFVNGRLLFTGEAGYLSRDSAYLGTLTLGRDAVYLDLQAGANELMLAIAETFGGWGFAARIEPPSAVVVER